MNKLMMKLTIGSEAIFFLSLIVAYLYFWRNSHFQMMAAEHTNAKMVGLFTLFLLFSSFSFWQAEKAQAKLELTKAKWWLGITIASGAIFLGGQAREYYHLIQENLTINENLFGSSFYTLTGFHALHVLIGLVVLGILLALCIGGNFKNQKSSAFAAIGIYWHFVDAVWLVVFTIIYLLPHFL